MNESGTADHGMILHPVGNSPAFRSPAHSLDPKVSDASIYRNQVKFFRRFKEPLLCKNEMCRPAPTIRCRGLLDRCLRALALLNRFRLSWTAIALSSRSANPH